MEILLLGLAALSLWGLVSTAVVLGRDGYRAVPYCRERATQSR